MWAGHLRIEVLGGSRARPLRDPRTPVVLRILPVRHPPSSVSRCWALSGELGSVCQYSGDSCAGNKW